MSELNEPRSPSMKRIEKDSVTDTLIQAMDEADRMKFVIVLYETKESEDTSHGFIYSGDTTLARVNYLIDIFKSWLLKH